MIHVTNELPAMWNEKTIIKFDKLVNDAKSSKLCENNMFKLLEYDEYGLAVEASCKGAWILCDNGFLK